jgi:drug/metabolite transporter (DMT)-like permease
MKKNMIELHVAVIIMSATSLFAQLIHLPPKDIIAFRCLIAALALFLFCRLTRTRLTVDRGSDLGWLLLLGLLIAVHWITFFTAIQMSGVAVGLTAFFSFTIMTVLMEPFFFHERMDRRDLAVALIVIVGIYLAVPGEISGGRVAVGAAFGIGSAFLYALRNILYRKHLSRYPSGAMMFYQVSIAGFALLPFLTPGIDLLLEHRWVYLILLGVIFTAAAHTLFVGSLRTISASKAGLITSLEPVYGMIFAAAILSEIPGIRTAAGAMIVVGAAVYTSLHAHRTEKQPEQTGYGKPL